VAVAQSLSALMFAALCAYTWFNSLRESKEA
jgi:hypothetical protein